MTQNTTTIEQTAYEMTEDEIASELAMEMCDRDPNGDLIINGMIVSYSLQTGNRITPYTREKAIGIYHTWQAENEYYAEKYGKGFVDELARYRVRSGE